MRIRRRAPTSNNMNKKTKILILGSGFGGLYTALNLDKTLARDPNVVWTYFFPFPGFTNEAFKPGSQEPFSVRAVRGGAPD